MCGKEGVGERIRGGGRTDPDREREEGAREGEGISSQVTSSSDAADVVDLPSASRPSRLLPLSNLRSSCIFSWPNRWTESVRGGKKRE